MKGLGMRSYWYVSANKLQAMGAVDAGLLGRLNARAKLGAGLASLEVGLDSAATRALGHSAARAEKQLRRRRAVKDVAEFASGPPPAVYFHSYGPACRAVIAGMFWVAVIEDDIAVLLVGSASNAVAAAPAAAPAEMLSPTADPMGAARSLREHLQQPVPVLAAHEIFSPATDPIGAARYLLDHPHRTVATADDIAAALDPHRDVSGAELRHANTLAYAWDALLSHSLDLLDDDISGLPRAQSLAQYVARHRIQNPAPGWQADVKWLALGTPVYVAQTS